MSSNSNVKRHIMFSFYRCRQTNHVWWSGDAMQMTINECKSGKPGILSAAKSWYFRGSFSVVFSPFLQQSFLKILFLFDVLDSVWHLFGQRISCSHQNPRIIHVLWSFMSAKNVRIPQKWRSMMKISLWLKSGYLPQF